MFKKLKTKANEASLRLASSLMASPSKVKNIKGDTQLVVLVLLLMVVAVAIMFFREQFFEILNQAMKNLKDTFNNLFEKQP